MRSEGFTQTTNMGGSYKKSSTDELINSITAQLSKRTSESDSSNVNYTNTNILAENGAININSTNNDTNIIGANLAANDIVITSGHDLNIESLQNKSNSKSKSKSVGAGGGNGSGSLSYNANRSSFERDWVDDQTGIIATNSVRIDTAGNTDIKGAVIANQKVDGTDGGNLIINTGTLTYSDIIDTEKQESSGFGISTNVSLGSNASGGSGGKGLGKGGSGKSAPNPAAKNQGQDRGYYPAGSTSLSLSNQGYEREQITRATIGAGVINISDSGDGGNIGNEGNGQTQNLANLNRDMDKSQEITKDTITGALDVSVTIDNRIIGVLAGNDEARVSLNKTTQNMPENVKNAADQVLALTTTPYSAAGAVYGFAGHAYSHALGGGKSDFNYNDEIGALEFEDNPWVTRPFTLGHTVNYSKTQKPNQTMHKSYTGSMLTPSGYPTISDHENAHIKQYDNWGILFGPAYVINGIYEGINNKKTVNPNNHHNWFEVDADQQAKNNLINRK